MLGICFLYHVYHVDGESANESHRSYAKWFYNYMYMKMTKYIF